MEPRIARPADPLAGAFAAALVALAAAPALAGTIQVPTEEHPTLQSAVDAAADGDTIVVAAGNLDTSASLDGRNNLRIHGLPGSTLLSSGIYLTNCDRISIDGLTFVDESDTTSAIIATDCTGLALKKLTVVGYDQVGIRLVSCDGPRVTACTVKDGPGGGLRDVDSIDLVVEKCVFEGLGGLAIALSSGEGTASDRARVSKCTITSESGGIAGEGAALRVEGNTLTLGTGDGIVIGAAAEIPGALVQKNVVASSGFAFRGIDVRATLGKVAKNTVTGPLSVGVFVRGDGNRIEKNTATGQAQCFNLSLSDLMITGNTAVGPLDIGFIVQQGSGARISKNRVLEGGDSNGFSVTQQDVLLTRNYVEDAYNAFFLGFGPMTLVGNVAVGSTNADLTTGEPASKFTLVRNRFDVVLFDVPVEPPPI